MKKEIGFIIFLAVISAVFLSGAYASCDSSQLIMNLSSAANAHGQVWDGSANYPVGICYNDIFNSNFNEANPHNCDGSNNIIKLSSSTNAHAEGPAGTNYPVNICYGNLECVSRTASSCEHGESVVLSLSSDTNAHLASGNYGLYPVKICCKPGTNAPKWSRISSDCTDDVQKQDTVKMMWDVSNLGIGEGTSVQFEVWEQDQGAPDNHIATVFSTVDADKKAVAKFTITDGYYQAGGGEKILMNSFIL